MHRWSQGQTNRRELWQHNRVGINKIGRHPKDTSVDTFLTLWPSKYLQHFDFQHFDFDFAKTKLWLWIHKIWNTSWVSKYLQDFWLSTCQNKTLTINTFKMNIEHTQNIFHIAFGNLCSWMRNNVVKVGIGTLNIPNFKVL